MFTTQHAINRIVRKLSRDTCAVAYALHIEHGKDAGQIADMLNMTTAQADSAIRAGRALNDADAFADMGEVRTLSTIAGFIMEGFPASAYLRTDYRQPVQPSRAWRTPRGQAAPNRYSAIGGNLRLAM